MYVIVSICQFARESNFWQSTVIGTLESRFFNKRDSIYSNLKAESGDVHSNLQLPFDAYTNLGTLYLDCPISL